MPSMDGYSIDEATSLAEPFFAKTVVRCPCLKSVPRHHRLSESFSDVKQDELPPCPAIYYPTHKRMLLLFST